MMQKRLSAGFGALLVLLVLGGPAGGQDEVCVGDCSGDEEVAINELITCVNIALGNADVSTCPACDANDDGEVAINELIMAVNNALEGCGPPPTEGPTPTPTEGPTGFCGNGVVDVEGEECDDGGMCIGGTNAQEPCTSAGDCPGGECRPVGGDKCAFNCTNEGDPPRTGRFITGPQGICDGGSKDGNPCGDTSDCSGGRCDCPEGEEECPGRKGTCVGGTADGMACSNIGSCPGGVCDCPEDQEECKGTIALVQTQAFPIPLELVGSMQIITGDPVDREVRGPNNQVMSRPGEYPLVMTYRPDDTPREEDLGLKILPVSLPGLVCACVRGVETRSLFGPLPKDSQGQLLAANVATGVISCGDTPLMDNSYVLFQDHNVDPSPDTCDVSQCKGVDYETEPECCGNTCNAPNCKGPFDNPNWCMPCTGSPDDPEWCAGMGECCHGASDDPECDDSFTFTSGLVSEACTEMNSLKGTCVGGTKDGQPCGETKDDNIGCVDAMGNPDGVCDCPEGEEMCPGLKGICVGGVYDGEACSGTEGCPRGVCDCPEGEEECPGLCSDPEGDQHPGNCRSNRWVEFYGGEAPKGSTLWDLNISIGLLRDSGQCDETGWTEKNGKPFCRWEEQYGPDCMPCTPDDDDIGDPENLPAVTAVAEAAVIDANDRIILPQGINRCSECSGAPCQTFLEGQPFDCEALAAKPQAGLEGMGLVVCWAAIDSRTIGDDTTCARFHVE